MGRAQPGSLMARTAELMKGRDPIKVSHDTGLNYFWLVKFSKGGVKDPSVNTVQALYEYLVGTKLDLA